MQAYRDSRKLLVQAVVDNTRDEEKDTGAIKGYVHDLQDIIQLQDEKIRDIKEQNLNLHQEIQVEIFRMRNEQEMKESRRSSFRRCRIYKRRWKA